MRQQSGATSGLVAEKAMIPLSRSRLIEIGVAVGLTVAALLFLAWSAWAEDSGLTVTEAWARPTIGEGRMTVAYMTIGNPGSTEVVLKGVGSPKAARVELHETKMSEDGVMQMRPLANGLPIAAGGEAMLAPGGAHIMVMGLKEPLAEGDELPLTLEFAEAATMKIAVPVRKSVKPARSNHHNHH
jgi:copper(I)-binding protein